MKAYIMNNQIKYDTGKASLITLPSTNGQKFWISNNLIYDKNEYSKIIYLPEGYTFNAVSGARDKNKFKISSERVYELLSKTTAPNKKIKPKVRIEKHIPERIKPKKAVIDNELKR
ncbi:hypothetical protein [Ligilactobacillus sp. LYQ135]